MNGQVDLKLTVSNQMGMICEEQGFGVASVFELMYQSKCKEYGMWSPLGQFHSHQVYI